MDIEQNIEILWYITNFLPQGYGTLLRFVSKTFKEAVDTIYVPVYTGIISEYGLKPNLIEQFRLGSTIDIYSRSKSKWLKLLRWSRKYHPDTDILLLYACSLDDHSLINSICNISQIPPKNVNMCLDFAFKNGNMLIIKRLYECVEDLKPEHLLWLSIIHNQPVIFVWLINNTEISGPLYTELMTLAISFRPIDNSTIDSFLHASWLYLSETTYTKEDFMRVLREHAINKARPFYYRH